MSREAKRMATEYAAFARRLIDVVDRPPHRDAWRRAYFPWRQQHDAAQSPFVSDYSQAVACALMTLRGNRNQLSSHAVRNWLIDAADPLCGRILHDCFALFDDRQINNGRSPPSWAAKVATSLRIEAADDAPTLPPAECYEWFLGAFDTKRRSARGVYVTPAPLARFVLRSVHDVLQDEFGLRLGLADTTTCREFRRHHKTACPSEPSTAAGPLVRILDPAAGSGAFLVEVIGVVHQALVEQWTKDGCNQLQVQQKWNAYVVEHLLPRLVGIELMLAPCVAAHVNIAATLAQTGFRFETPGKLRLHVADALAPADERESMTGLDQEAFSVIVGNPPFLASALPGHDWIDKLLKGRDPSGGAVANYFEVDGQPLGERKLWLHDDYVKFFRLAHWQIERAGCGIVGLVTNHGYLDNVTFRGMRQQLISTFPRMAIVDLHGNRKKKEVAPDGGADENVFAIDQGIAVGVLRRPPHLTGTSIEIVDLWGTRQEKLDLLSQSSITDLHPQPLSPASPEYLFTPRDDAVRHEYQRGWRLPEVMPIGTTAPVTARDGFVVALSQNELVDRLSEFRDLGIPDDEIRSRYFGNGRSVRYPPGDTRGWKMSEARRQMAGDADWRRKVSDCQYRPLDFRSIYWAESMIDWPRSSVMHHLQQGENVALIARRQMPPGGPCNYFWATRELALDGVIRSDNRGSESLFPLYVYDDEKRTRAVRVRPNLAPEFIAAISAQLGLHWIGAGQGDLRKSLGALDVAHYIYALFHSPRYRTRYAHQLCSDFPRIFLTGDRVLFARLAALGGALLNWHTWREAPPATNVQFNTPDDADAVVERGFPKYADGQVSINRRADFSGVPLDAWQFHVGAHQVCRKWLKDRRGRRLAPADVDHYRRTVAVLAETIRAMQKIDYEIDRRGGWPKAFCED